MRDACVVKIRLLSDNADFTNLPIVPLKFHYVDIHQADKYTQKALISRYRKANKVIIMSGPTAPAGLCAGYRRIAW